MKQNFKSRTVFLGDNLDFLRGMNSACVDLIYADPPFNKKKKFVAPIGSQADGASFLDYFTQADIKDEWVEEMRAENYELHSLLVGVKAMGNSDNYCYLVYMAIRILECHRLLKDTGVMYLHCDQTMSHYLKLLMDCIFGNENFRNEIIWKKGREGSGTRNFPTESQNIFRYSKNKRKYFHFCIRKEYQMSTVANIKKDDNGWYYTRGREGTAPRDGVSRNLKTYVSDDINKSKAEIIRTVTSPGYTKGAILGDNWSDIANVQKTGYPTEKPVLLMERIITASSKKGDLVLDPFCGCTTTCIAAERLGRNWVGIDVANESQQQIRQRLKDEVPADLLRGEINISFSPPKRGAEESRTRKYVYVISNPAYQGMYKVGVATDAAARLNSYQTGDPRRGYKLEYKILTAEYKTLEPYIHRKFNSDHEWVPGKLEEIIASIKNYQPPQDNMVMSAE